MTQAAVKRKVESEEYCFGNEQEDLSTGEFRVSCQ
jgi:hypothetical protein